MICCSRCRCAAYFGLLFQRYAAAVLLKGFRWRRNNFFFSYFEECIATTVFLANRQEKDAGVVVTMLEVTLFLIFLLLLLLAKWVLNCWHFFRMNLYYNTVYYTTVYFVKLHLIRLMRQIKTQNHFSFTYHTSQKTNPKIIQHVVQWYQKRCLV